jgi:hypothetical protein
MSEMDLKEKILDEINKTGFPLELRISKFLQENEYHIANNLYYIDLDENKGREVDMRALKNFRFKENDEEYFVRHCLLIECKRSTDKPWVIFTSPITAYDMGVYSIDAQGFSKVFTQDIYGEERWRLYNKLDEIHPFNSYPRRGRSYFEAFKNKETGETIFKALTTSVKATIAMRDDSFASGGRSICFYYPIIVFEGKLFEAYFERNNMCVAEADSTIVSFFYESAKYKQNIFSVSLVTEGIFSNFVSKLDSVLSFWGEELKKNTKWFSI